MSFGITSSKDLLSEYMRIAGDNNSQKISFYLKNEDEIRKIRLNERLEIEKDFLISLFQNGEFENYLQRCDQVIDQLFDARLFPDFDKSTLSALLFHKAASLFNMHQYDKSKQSLVALIKIDKKNINLHRELLVQIFSKKLRLEKHKARGIIIAMILVSAILSIWNVLIIDPFYSEYYQEFQISVWVILTAAMALWYFSEKRIKSIAIKKAEHFLVESEETKN
jgi:hypothetical protein